MGIAISVIALNNTERGTMEKIVDGCVWQLEHALNIRDGDMTWQAFTRAKTQKSDAKDSEMVKGVTKLRKTNGRVPEL